MLLPETQSLPLAGVLHDFQRRGFARLGPILSDEGARELGARADRLMSGAEAHPGIFYQHDSPSGRYDELKFGEGWVGPSPRYRKLERLERDPLFLSWIQNALFERITRALLGDRVTLYRSVLWNKAPHRGMAVPWHQDDGRFWGLDRPPFVQIWTALDDASVASGCLEVVPGSHKLGLATAEGGTVTDARLQALNAEDTAVSLPARRGEAILVHNHIWHRTGRNVSAAPRKALSISFLHADTRCTRRRRAPRRFLPLF